MAKHGSNNLRGTKTCFFLDAFCDTDKNFLFIRKFPDLKENIAEVLRRDREHKNIREIDGLLKV